MVDAKGEGSIMAALELKEDSLAKVYWLVIHCSCRV